MILYDEKKNCCGCGVCSEICELDAIIMKLDEEGFLYPHIDEEKCINCGKCKRNCAFQKLEEVSLSHPIESYAAKHIEEEVRVKSQSGGAFSALSDYALEHNGSVHGVALDKEFMAYHMQAKNKITRDMQRGSKYIQSILYPALKTIKQDACGGKPTVITGTPCQIAAVKNYLKSCEYEKVYFIEILCHGVASPMIWKEVLNWCERTNKEKIKAVVFRDKASGGWRGTKSTVEFENKKIESPIFRNLFYEHYVLRPSCYSCPYTCVDRIADITIGDCWGIEKNAPDLDDDKGLSLVLINTEKGKELFSYTEEKMELHKINLQQYIQTPLKNSANKPRNREKFWRDYRKKGFDYIVRKYASDSARKKNKRIENIKKKVIKVFKR